jgi:hypothetical protein
MYVKEEMGQAENPEPETVKEEVVPEPHDHLRKEVYSLLTHKAFTEQQREKTLRLVHLYGSSEDYLKDLIEKAHAAINKSEADKATFTPKLTPDYTDALPIEELPVSEPAKLDFKVDPELQKLRDILILGLRDRYRMGSVAMLTEETWEDEAAMLTS